MSVWIGEIQWMRRNGFDARDDPMLSSRSTRSNAAMRAERRTGREAAWPAADVVVGNPPFLGDKRMRGELGDEYSAALRKAYDGRVPAGRRLGLLLVREGAGIWRVERQQRAGLVATNSIRGGATAGAQPDCRRGRDIRGVGDEPWIDRRRGGACFARLLRSEELDRQSWTGASGSRFMRT